MDQNTIGLNIVRLRKAKGLSQKELAEKLNYSDKVISKWERGESLPDIIAIEAMSKFFGISIDEFVRGDTCISEMTESVSQSNLTLLHIKKPSKLVLWLIVPVTILWLVTIFTDIYIFLASSFIYSLFLILYGFLISYNKWETEYNGHTITIVNKPTKAYLIIDGVIVDQDLSLLKTGIKLHGKLDDKHLNVYISSLFTVKCEAVII